MSLKKIFVWILMLCIVSVADAQKLNQDFLNYINKHKETAIKEMERAGVPASIKLAQGLLESNAGRSYLARKANNHFGIKCGSNWKGESVEREDDDYDDKGNLIPSCFRKYKSTEACFIAHSEFLRDPRKHYRYGFLFELETTDYKGWAKGLKKAGYATSSTYSDKLIKLIKTYELYKYDQPKEVDAPEPNVEEIIAGILSRNDVKYTKAGSNETVEDIAKRVDVSLRRLLSYNEKLSSGSQVVEEGDRVYLQPKRNSFQGRKKYHIVRHNETIADISNFYAVKESKLRKKNRLVAGEEPARGESIKLRGWWKVKNKPLLTTEVKEEEKKEETEPSTIETDDDGYIEMEEEEEEDATPITPPTPTPTPTPTPEVEVEEKEEESTVKEEAEIILDNEPDFSDEEEVEVVTPPSTTTAVYHVVKKGETLWKISTIYKVKVDDIKRLNKLTSNSISVGQKLKVKE